MADPFSIATGALAVITAAQATGAAIYKFIRNCKEARTDLAHVSRELSELTLILQLIKDDSVAATKDCLPDALQTQVQNMLASCTTTIQQIERIVAKCREKPGPLRWTIFEKENVATLKVTLEAFKSGLGLVLETVNLSLTRKIKNNTEAIQDSTTEIRRDTNEILRQIYQLRIDLPSSCPPDQERLRLEQWLDGLTHYAETIIAGEVPDDVSDTSDLPSHTEEQEPNDEIVPLDKFGEQEGLGDETASQPLAPPFLDTVPIAPEAGLVGSGRGVYQLSKRLDRPKDGPLDIGKSAAELHNPSERGSNPIPYKIVASVPSSSPVVNARYCAEVGVWAILHKDSVLRFWSSRSGEIIKSLKVLREDHGGRDANVEIPDGLPTTLKVCSAKPELILVKMRNRKIEVWNWKESYRITLPTEARQTFIARRVSFALQSALMYAINRHGALIMVDLNALRVPLTPLRLSPGNSLYVRAFFVSHNEIWTLSTPGSLTLSSSHQLNAQIVHLPSASEAANHQGGSVSAVYNDTVFERACVTAKYQFPAKLRRTNAAVDPKRRTLIMHNPNPPMMHGLNLDTGAELFRLNLDTDAGCLGRDASLNSVKFVTSHRYFFHRRPSGVRVIRIKDGRDLGGLSPRGWPDSLELYASTKSGKAVFYRYNEANSSMEFGITDVSLDELAEETTK